MKTEVLNGKDVRSGIPQKSDTQKGAMAIAEAKKEAVNPLTERLRKVNEMQKQVERRKRLIDAQDKINLFEEGLNGEDDEITLRNGKNRTLEITKPDALKKVVELLKKDVQEAVKQVDNELLTATI